MMSLTLLLGSFHGITAIQADNRHISILDHRHSLFLVPVYPAATFEVRGSLGPANLPHDGAIYLDHLELRDVSLIQISPALLSVTCGAMKLEWKVHRHVPQVQTLPLAG